ncbi:MAG: nitroreductase family deazaflavin-dependent oxidoreductase [Actinomycetales bacterium]|nr:nitroreductase family deazaflavin-dependent oxidoreductase [Actinomycetales bacterium]
MHQSGVSGDGAAWPAEALDAPFAYLTTTGRVSGRPHRIEIWFALDGQRVFLMSGGRDRSDWVKNLMVTPEATVEIAGVRRSGRAVVVGTESPDDALARRLLVSKYQRRDELRDWGVRSLPVVIEVG